MDFEPNEEQRAIRDMARDFARAELAPHAVEWDARSHFPVATLRAAAALGLAGIYVREELGGSGLGRIEAALVFEDSDAGIDAARSAGIEVYDVRVRPFDSLFS